MAIEELSKIRERGENLKSMYANRNEIMDQMENIVLLLDEDVDKRRRQGDHVKTTLSTDLRDKVLGAVRLMTATDPTFSVPEETNDEQVIAMSSDLEKAAKQLWWMAGRVAGQPIHYDAVLSMLTFGQMHILIESTQDLAAHAEKLSPAKQRQFQRIAARTPFTYEVLDPRTGYPKIGKWGMEAYYQERETTAGDIRDEFGSVASNLKGDDDTPTILCNYWDDEYRYAWVYGEDNYLVSESHGLPNIPIIVQLGEGSRLFEDPEYWSQPFLFGVYRSEMWKRQNLALTVFFTNLFGIGGNPMFKYTRNDPQKTVDIDWSVAGGLVYLDQGESMEPLQKNLVDDGLIEGFRLLEEKISQGTIYNQTLGEPLGGDNFSMVALLHQAGRLPLTVPQRKASWGIADAVRNAFEWAKAEKIDHRIWGELDLSKLPDVFELSASLEVSLPQDTAQQANTAVALTAGENPLTSQRWAREKVLKIGQSDEMTKEIWAEKSEQILYANFIDQMMQLVQQMQQPNPMQMPGGEPGGGPGPNGNMPAGEPGAQPYGPPPFEGPPGSTQAPAPYAPIEPGQEPPVVPGGPGG